MITSSNHYLTIAPSNLVSFYHVDRKTGEVCTERVGPPLDREEAAKCASEENKEPVAPKLDDRKEAAAKSSSDERNDEVVAQLMDDLEAGDLDELFGEDEDEVVGQMMDDLESGDLDELFVEDDDFQ